MQVTAETASEQAIRALQNSLPPSLSRKQAPVEVEGVLPSLLLEPLTSSGIPSALTGGSFSLGARVAFVGASGGPPLASRGTVIGCHDQDFEVLFDTAFHGGTDLQGRYQAVPVMSPASDHYNPRLLIKVLHETMHPMPKQQN